MITAYFLGIYSMIEGEDIEVRYAIYEDDKLITKKNELQKYKIPAVVSQIALLTVIKEIEKYKGQEITLVFNDGALNEQIKGTSTTKNLEVIKIADVTRTRLRKFGRFLTIKDVSREFKERTALNEILL